MLTDNGEWRTMGNGRQWNIMNKGNDKQWGMTDNGELHAMGSYRQMVDDTTMGSWIIRQYNKNKWVFDQSRENTWVVFVYNIWHQSNMVDNVGMADNWNLWTMGNDKQWGMTDNGELHTIKRYRQWCMTLQWDNGLWDNDE